MEQPGEEVSIVNRNRPQRQHQQHRYPSPQQEQQVADLANRMKDIFQMESAGGAAAGASDPTMDGNLRMGFIHPEGVGVHRPYWHTLEQQPGKWQHDGCSKSRSHQKLFCDTVRVAKHVVDLGLVNVLVTNSAGLVGKLQQSCSPG